MSVLNFVSLGAAYFACFFGIVFAINTYYLDEHCNRHIELLTDDQTFRVNASRQYYYPHDLSCNLTLTAEPNSEHIMFYFKYIDIRADLSCGIDWLEIHDGDSTQSPPVCGIIDLLPGRNDKICGINIHTSTALGYRTHDHILTFYFKTGPKEHHPNEHYKGFEIILTRFRYAPCDSDEYLCNNHRCIDRHRTCNGLNPCGDNSDCPRSTEDDISKMIWIGMVCVVVGLGIGMGLMKFSSWCWMKRCTKAVESDGKRGYQQIPDTSSSADTSGYVRAHGPTVANSLPDNQSQRTSEFNSN